jgi:rhodanese-related sulfurtransferase
MRLAVEGACAAVCAAVLAAAVSARAGEPYRELSVDEAAKLVDAKAAAVYDADPPDLYAKGHLPGARLVSYKSLDPSLLPADKDAKLVFYCHNRR